MSFLNVGCGGSKSTHIKINNKNVLNLDIDKNAKWLNVNASINYLPFIDNSFDYIICYHVLEHLLNPIDGLRELKRVARKKIFLKIPNGLHYYKIEECNEHLYSWNPQTFKQFLSVVFSNFKIYMVENIRFSKRNLNYYRVKFLQIISNYPNEITAICYV